MLARQAHHSLAISRLIIGTSLCLVGPATLAGPPELSPIEFLPGDDTLGPAVQDQEDVVIEAGGGGYLAVWSDERAVLSGNINAPGDELAGNLVDIYGQLLDADGNRVGGPIVISNQGRNQDDPDLAWNEAAQAWLVAFESDQPDWYFNQNVYAVRVAADGTVLDPDPILLMQEENGQGAYDPAVASDGQNWLVVSGQWFGDPSRPTVRGRRVAADGSTLEPQAFTVMQTTSLMFPDVAFADGVYLVVEAHRSQNDVWGQRFDVDVNPIGNLFFIGEGLGTSDASVPRVASNGSRFMVIGRDAHRVETDGTVIDQPGIHLGGNSSGFYMDVGWTGEEWVTSMALSVNATIKTYFQRIANDGTLIDTSPIEVEDVSQGWPQKRTSVAGLDGKAVIGYPLLVNAPFSTANSIRSALLEDEGTVSNLQTISLGLPRQSRVQLVHGPGNEMLAVFLSERDGEMRILSQRITTSGVVLDSEPTVVHAANLIGSQPMAAWNGEVYLIVWTLGDTTVGKRLSAENALIDGNPLPIATTPPAGQSYTAGGVGAAGDVFVVGIFHRINFHEPVRYVTYVRVRGTDGEALDADPVLLSGGFSRTMIGSSFGDKAILAWDQYNTHDSPSAYTEAIIIDAAGERTSRVRLSAQRGKEPDVAIGEDRALVVWHDDTTIHQDDVEGRFIFPDGTTSASEFGISTANNEQMYPAASWDGLQFVVAWSDYRHIQGIEQERANIRAARVTEGGAVLDPNGLIVTDTQLPEDLPAVGGGNGNAVIMFSMLNGIDGVPEIQRLGYRVTGAVRVAAAVLTDFAVVFGSLISGDLDALRDSDNVIVRAQSQYGFLSSEPNVVDLRVGYTTNFQSPAQIDLAVEARLNNPNGNVKLRLRNFDTGNLEQVHQYVLGTTEMRETVSVEPAGEYVRESDGRIELSMKTIVVATFSTSGFRIEVDQVEVLVR
ncbi:MAG: hypothetical protein ACR2GY_12600 [Phycisphaerales bacterium]